MTAAGEHPASQAWSRLRPDARQPLSVEFLRRKSSDTIHRLRGSGIHGSDVIAKRCRRDKAQLEELVYRQLYPRLPEPTLHFYGSVGDADPAFGWLFLEDVGDVQYSLDTRDQRRRIARWFGHAHAVAAALDWRSRLPNREPAAYRAHLRDVLTRLPPIAAERSLDAAAREVVSGILAVCDDLERDWSTLHAFCEDQPRTLVHGNCLLKNVHVRPDGRAAPFDWGGAGWGIAGTDLGQLVLPYRNVRPAPPDLAAYRSIVIARWPSLRLDTVVQLANLGQLFWSLRVIGREIPAFDYEWAAPADTVRNLQIYSRALHDALGSARW